MFRLRMILLHKREPQQHRLVRPHPLRRERALGEDGRSRAPEVIDHRRVAARDAEDAAQLERQVDRDAPGVDERGRAAAPALSQCPLSCISAM